MTPDRERGSAAPAALPDAETPEISEIPVIDWGLVLRDLDRGDPVAVAQVSRVISGFLNRFRAYELRDSWEDLRQEVLEILIRSHRRGVLRHPGAFVSYTGRIVWSRLALRTRRKDRPPQSLPEFPSQVDPDLRLDLERALEALSERERAVVDAIYLRGMNYQAAADELRLPLGTLKRLQTGALRLLRESLGVIRKVSGTAEGISSAAAASMEASRDRQEGPS